MKTVVIVQARMTSTRLPGKVMLLLRDKTVLGQVLTRCSQIQGIDEVCCAIPEESEHNILVNEAKKYNSRIFRGSEKDVLARYYEAAKALKADVVMRVTSDCPLIDPQVCSQVLSLHLSSDKDYTCNNMPPSWPHGFDCEVFNFEVLAECYKNAFHADEREHVTEWMRKHLKTQNLLNPDGNLEGIRITLDTNDDYTVLKKIFNSHIAKIDYQFIKTYFKENECMLS